VIPLLVTTIGIIVIILLFNWNAFHWMWCKLGIHFLFKKNTWMHPEEEEEIGWRIGMDSCACRKKKHYWISD